MLCSACSRVVRPVVAVDIDGTLADYHTHFLNFLEAYIGWRDARPIYLGRSSFKQWCMDLYDISEAEWERIKLAYRQGAQKRNMPIFDWAQVLTGIVRHEGAELWITTTRPFQRLDNIDPDTQAWLARHDIEYDGLIYGKYKYQMLAEQVDKDRVVAVIDDLPDKIEEARSILGAAVPIFKLGKYNSGDWRFLYLSHEHDLKTITAEIVERIAKWKDTYK